MDAFLGTSFYIENPKPGRVWLYLNPVAEVIGVYRDQEVFEFECDPAHTVRWELPATTTTEQLFNLFKEDPYFEGICEVIADNDLDEDEHAELMRDFFDVILHYIPDFQADQTPEFLGQPV